MKARRIVMLISLLAIGLSLMAPTIAVAQNQTPSILSRLQVVEDPELGELIRAAMEYRRQYYGPAIEEELAIIRKVTESYAQIKLLDRQIELLDRRVGAAAGPEALQYELILARAELEAKRTTAFGNLREVVSIMPDYAFKPKPAEKLKACLRFDAIGTRIYVTEGLQPFSRDAADMSYAPGRFVTEVQALEFVKKHLAQKDALPIRIDIYRNAQGVTLSQEFERDVIELIRKAGVEMQAEVHLDDSARQEPKAFTLCLERGRIATGLKRDSRHVPQVELDGFIEPNDVGQYVRGLLLTYGFLPATINFVHDPTDAALATQVTQTIQQTVQNLDLTQCVEVTLAAEERDPARRYLGQWEAKDQGEDLTIIVGERSHCWITEVEGQSSRRKQTTWSFDDGKIRILNNIGSSPRDMHGSLDAEGNLVIEPSENEAPITFKRVE